MNIAVAVDIGFPLLFVSEERWIDCDWIVIECIVPIYLCLILLRCHDRVVTVLQ